MTAGRPQAASHEGALRFALLGSGSRGNATLVCRGRTRILIDCGFSVTESARRLGRLGVEPDGLTAIVVTHEHSDHLRGVAPLARRYALPVWMTPGTRAQCPDEPFPALHLFDPHSVFSIGDLELRPLPVPHDAREPCQFVLHDGAQSLGVVSDAGHVTRHMVEALAGLDALLLEANHDVAMLAQGPYPAMLKQRVGGAHGHLSNAQTAELLGATDTSRLRHLALTHLSEKNNTPELARAAAAQALNCTQDWIQVAEQDAGLGWREL